MNKKNLIICLLIVFLLTGCNAKYSLEIKNNIVKETLTITGNNDDDRLTEKDESNHSFYDYSKMYGQDYNIDTKIEGFHSDTKCNVGCLYYNKEYIDKDGIIGFKLTNDFSFTNYSSSTIANELIPAFVSSYDGRYLEISGGPNWNYYNDYKYLDKLEMFVDTEYEVVSTNMNKISTGKYKIDFNGNDDVLYINLDTKTIIKSVINDDNKDTITYMIILVGILFIALIILIFKDRKKYR